MKRGRAARAWRGVLAAAALLAVVAVSLSAREALAARKLHRHDDLFNERAIFMGLKAGPQITTYTPMTGSGQEFPVQSSAGAVVGPAIEFVYTSVRLEFGAFWATRNGINTSDTLNAVGIPFLLKFPAEISSATDLEVGVGLETDAVISGPAPHNNVLVGALASVGLLSDLGGGTMLSFETRYNIGLKQITPTINGGAPRDLQLIAGMMWLY